MKKRERERERERKILRDVRLGQLWLTLRGTHIQNLTFSLTGRLMPGPPPLLLGGRLLAGCSPNPTESLRICVSTANLLSLCNILNAHSFFFRFSIHVIYFRCPLFTLVHILFRNHQPRCCQKSMRNISRKRDFVDQLQYVNWTHKIWTTLTVLMKRFRWK